MFFSSNKNMNLQTLAYIQTIENNLLANISETKEEINMLSDFMATQTFLTTHVSTSLNKEEDIDRRRTVIRSLDVFFHRHYRKLCGSFKKAIKVYLQIAPGIDEKIGASSVPTIQALVSLYNKKREILQNLFLRDTISQTKNIFVKS